jgi:hypothetical protein
MSLKKKENVGLTIGVLVCIIQAFLALIVLTAPVGAHVRPYSGWALMLAIAALVGGGLASLVQPGLDNIQRRAGFLICILPFPLYLLILQIIVFAKHLDTSD